MNQTLVEDLKKAMQLLEDQAASIKIAREKFEDSLKGELIVKSDLEFTLGVIKNKLITEALEEFKKTGNKKLLGGIGIREGSTMTYDPEKALKFAKEKDMFLQLDKKAFEKVAPSLCLDFVFPSKKTTVTFPKVVTL